jgi:hypothetical protein
LNLPPPADIAAAFCCSLDGATRFEEPFLHFYVDNLLPNAVAEELAALPFALPAPSRTTGRRDDNAGRIFFGVAEMALYPAMQAVAEALQSPAVTRQIGALFAAPLRGCHLRLEYTIDEDGFWLEPHTDIGVKKFTCLISLADYNLQSSLGTDIYNMDNSLHKRAPFRRNGALMFVPSAESWHGFAPRPIEGRRKSLILNYVGPGWRARDQLSFPEEPVGLE